jgi:putative transposase
MARKNLIRTSLYPYHITARAHNKVPFPIRGLTLWETAQISMSEAYQIHPIELISFVMMDNHYHMFLYTPDSNLDSFLYEFNKRLALKIQKQSGHLNQVFGGRYKWCLVQSSNYLLNCYRYIYQNPLRAGVVSRCEEYELSTLCTKVHQKRFSIPLSDHFDLLDKAGLEWLNHFSAEENTIIKKGLKKSVFQDY